MKILRWTLKLHKWIALLVGIQIFIWIGTGLYFSIFPMEEIRGNHKKTEWTVEPFDPAQIISLEKAIENTGAATVKEAKLGHMMGAPVWRLTIPGDDQTRPAKTITVDGRTGTVLSPISEDLAVAIAKADYNGPGQYQSIEYFETSPKEASAGGKPRWAARFDDSENTVLYIDPGSADVKSSRSTKWRIFDFFFKLHVMDYDDGEDFDSLHLKIVSFVALLVVLSGFVLLFFRIRRFIRRRRAIGQGS